MDATRERPWAWALVPVAFAAGLTVVGGLFQILSELVTRYWSFEGMGMAVLTVPVVRSVLDGAAPVYLASQFAPRRRDIVAVIAATFATSIFLAISVVLVTTMIEAGWSADGWRLAAAALSIASAITVAWRVVVDEQKEDVAPEAEPTAWALGRASSRNGR